MATLQIHGDTTAAGPLLGLRFDLLADSSRTSPRLVIEAAAGRLVVSLAEEAGAERSDLLLARLHPHLQGMRLGLPSVASIGAVPPITSDDVRAVGNASRSGSPHAWASWFARAIADRDLVPPGAYAITKARDGERARERLAPSAAPFLAEEIDGVTRCLDRPSVSWVTWWDDDRELLRLRPPSLAGASRVKAWRKRARDGTLPPLLLWFVSGLDACVLLDGHDRLLAALEEGVSPRLLTLWRCCVRPRQVDVSRQQGVIEELAHRREAADPCRPALATDHENRLLLDAFPPGARLDPISRATPLRGGSGVFERRARKALGVLVDDRFLVGREPEGEPTGCSARCASELGWMPGS
jgi:hypothetical protein